MSTSYIAHRDIQDIMLSYFERIYFIYTCVFE